MALLEFGLGLSIGSLLCFGHHLYLQRRLHTLLRLVRPNDRPHSFSPISRLATALTEQQRNYQVSQVITANLQYLLDQAPIAYIQIDQDNQLQWCNAAAQQLLKIPPPSPTRPRLFLELIRSYDLDRLIEETRNQQQPCQREWIFNLIEANPANPSPQPTLYLLGHAFPLFHQEVGVFLENRQELVNLKQQRDRWVSDVAHELKTPLTSIRLVAETVHSRVAPSLQSWLDRLLNEVVHLSHLVEDLLNLGQLEQRSSQGLQLTTVDLVDLVYAAWETLEPMSQQRGIYLTYDGPHEFLIQGDRSQLYRAVLNLLDNATKYSPPDQAIQVILYCFPASEPIATSVDESCVDESCVDESCVGDRVDQPQVCLEIIDSGPGFSEQSLPHVFERFYRADPARHRAATGSLLSSSSPQPYRTSCGLGLAIVEQIITAHQGTVEANNHPETGGAWLKIYLPRQAVP